MATLNRDAARACGRISSKTVLAAAMALLALCAFLPYLAAARYALFYADDFSFVLTLREAAGASHFQRSLSAACGKWLGWQGAYSSTFLMFFLSPTLSYSYGALRALLLALLMGTAGAALLLAVLLCGYLGTERKNGVLIWALVSIPLLSLREYNEIYLWFTGAMAYLLPLMFAFLTPALLLLGKRGRKGLWYVLAGVSALMMSGGVLEAVGFGMYLLLLLCVLDRARTGRLDRGFCAVFILGLAGALLNVLAPGNYARAEVFSDPAVSALSRLLRALAVTARCLSQESARLCAGPVFPLFLLLALALGTDMKIKPGLFRAGLTVLGLLLLPAVTAFPVVLGYNAEDIAIFSVRTLFPFDLALMLSGVGIAMTLGCLLGVRLKRPPRFASAVGAGLLAVYLCLSALGVYDCVPADIAKNLRDGSISEYSTQWRIVYDYLDECGYEDVIVRRPMPEYRAGCALTKLAAYPEYWINQDIASYYGLKSLCLNPPREDAGESGD